MTFALHDGEDFELLFTLSKAQWKKLQQDKKLKLSMTAIGKIIEKGFYLSSNGKRSTLIIQSYNHKIGE